VVGWVKVFPAPAQKVVMAPKTWQIFWNTITPSLEIHMQLQTMRLVTHCD
jgi:hypothetical protein